MDRSTLHHPGNPGENNGFTVLHMPLLEHREQIERQQATNSRSCFYRRRYYIYFKLVMLVILLIVTAVREHRKEKERDIIIEEFKKESDAAQADLEIRGLELLFDPYWNNRTLSELEKMPRMNE